MTLASAKLFKGGEHETGRLYRADEGGHYGPGAILCGAARFMCARGSSGVSRRVDIDASARNNDSIQYNGASESSLSISKALMHIDIARIRQTKDVVSRHSLLPVSRVPYQHQADTRGVTGMADTEVKGISLDYGVRLSISSRTSPHR